ncbi:unnamed protein product [Enterobius vermicularis]|uniref:CUB domain-containing protein n=1 Tax=Enterobius vermicularis TaxID=51028 RepID=A0A0N4UWW4_ENTVE|nr:unnamed protein product [Enterobius vermicularis]
MDRTQLSEMTANATYSCTGEGVCEFISAGQYLTIRFQSGKGEPERYGFLGRVTPYSEPKRSVKSVINFVSGAVIALILSLISIGLYCYCSDTGNRLREEEKSEEKEETKKELIK